MGSGLRTFTGRSTAEEIAEAVLVAAERDHEERKLRYYGNLLANLAFSDGIDRAEANLLTRLAQGLSYAQLCLLSIFWLPDQNSLPPKRDDPSGDDLLMRFGEQAWVEQLWYLHQRELIFVDRNHARPAL